LHSDDPETIMRAQNARRKGGQRAHSPPSAVDLGIDLGSAAGILGTLQRVAEAVAAGRLDPRRASNLGYILMTATAARKIAAYEDRMARIERRLGLNQSPLIEDDDDLEAEDADEA
jgi:hypothetical protein